MIKTRGLTFAYGPGQPILDNIDLDLRPGERVAILGKNGSGKSTFLKCLQGLLTPTSGSVHNDLLETGTDLRVGLVFQNPDDQIVSPIVESEIAFGLENEGVPREEMVARVDQALERFNLKRYRSQDPHNLSGGELQRLAVASIVVIRPDFLLFDEPFSMLDPAARQDLSGLISTLHNDKITPIVVTQDPDQAADADRLLIFDNGRILADGTPTEILSDPAILRKAGLTSTTAGRLAEAAGLAKPVPVVPEALIASKLRIPPAASRADRASRGAPIIELQEVWYKYDQGLPTEHAALLDLSLTVHDGEIVSLMGPGGSGKTTLALHLNGLLTPSSGSATIVGLDARVPETHDALRQQVGLVFQFPESQLFGETVAGDVAYGPRNHGLDRIPDRVDEALFSVGLEPGTFRDRNPFCLSGGEKRRVALAGVLATSPSILVLDEPTAGLDPVGADQLDDLLLDLNRRGTTIVMITHDLARAAKLSDRVIGIERGRLVVDHPTADFLEDTTALSRLGIPIPVGISLIRRLRAAGHQIPEGIHTADQLATALTAST